MATANAYVWYNEAGTPIVHVVIEYLTDEQLRVLNSVFNSYENAECIVDIQEIS